MEFIMPHSFPPMTQHSERDDDRCTAANIRAVSFEEATDLVSKLHSPARKRGRPFRDRSNDPDLKAVTLRAVTRAGGMHEVGRARGISHQAVWRWVNVLGRIPLVHVFAMSRLSGIPPKELRPDAEWE